MKPSQNWSILDTMNFWMDSAFDELHNTIKHVDVITINDEEARQLTMNTR
jgi:sugar/nucleoside kinase (ribokinase family)